MKLNGHSTWGSEPAKSSLREGSIEGIARRSRGPSGGLWKQWSRKAFLGLALGLSVSSGSSATQLSITNISVRSNTVIVRWQGGAGPYQLLCRTNMVEDWRKVGTTTSASSA